MYTVAIFLDMSKAFDSIKHEILFKKLEMYGIRDNALNWYKNYMTGRKIRVKYNDEVSEPYYVEYSTAQGSPTYIHIIH